MKSKQIANKLLLYFGFNRLTITPTKRSISVWVKPNSNTNSHSTSQSTTNLFGSTSTLSKLRKQSSKDGMTSLRRSNNESNSQSQWYAEYPKNDTNSLSVNSNQSSQPVIELSEQLTPHRPLRSEIDRRLSRPNSGQYRTHNTHSPTRSLSHGASSNSLSLSPYMSPSGLDANDDKPPPLPVKQSYADYTNLPENENGTNGVDLTIVQSKRNSGHSSSSIKNKVSQTFFFNY